MKRKRALLLTITVLVVLCAACGVRLHVQRLQYDRNRALIDALKKSDFQTALALINAGADPNTRRDPLPAPTLLQLLTHLLHHMPPPDNNSPTTLVLACAADAKFRGSRLEPTVSEQAKLPLLLALLSHGVNVNAGTGAMGTALETAVVIHSPHIVELLLQHGADPNIPDGIGRTPLLCATMFEATDMAHLLLAHGANPNVQDGNGETVLYLALFASNAKDLIPDLMAHGADPNLPNKQGTTPLQFAQGQNRPDLVRLMKGGAGR